MTDLAPIGWPKFLPSSLRPMRPTVMQALGRGLRGRCPQCGKVSLFQGFLTVRPECPACLAPLGLIRADDAPPYFTIFIVAHLIVTSLVLVDRCFTLSVGTEMMIFMPATLGLIMALIRPVKGATVGLMWALGMATADNAS